ncbi:MAG TPA: ABC transporter permease [Bryobacteraceae bacterium]|nr:ABC transporter permease [Bryobacteraceae bacterium]
MPKRIPGTHFARNLIERRTLIIQLVKRDFQQRYIGSAAGWIWGLVHPLVLLGSYVFVFGIILQTKLGATEVTQNYPMWLFAGMLPWLLFSETVQRSAGCLIEQSNLITKTVFPAEIVPVSIFLSSLISHLLAVSIVVVGAALFLHRISPLLVMLPVVMLLIGLLAVGVGWVAAALQVYLRDTAQVLAVILTLWFWATPILVPKDKFPPWATAVLHANPLSYVVDTYRDLLLGHSVSAGDLGSTAAFAIVAFVCGGLIFRYMKRGFADVL